MFCFALLLMLWSFAPAFGQNMMDDPSENEENVCSAVPSFESVAFIADTNIELPCLCKPRKESIFWHYKKDINGPITAIYTETNDGPPPPKGFKKTMKKLVSKVWKTQDGKDFVVGSKTRVVLGNLIIHKIQTSDSGIYMCGNSQGEFFYGYDVDIQDTRKAHIAFQHTHQQVQPEKKTKSYTAFTSFLEWSACDRCDVRGEQRRLGLCYVRSPYLDMRFEVTSRREVSCGSSAVPERLQQRLSNRRPEIIIRSCNQPCYKGLLGKIVNTASKFIKLKEYIPVLKTPIEKHIHTLGSRLSISCPGAKPTDAVAWDKGSRPLYRSDHLIGQRKSSRVYIDHGNNLNFRYVTYSDKAVYYCWLQGKKKAGLQLDITTNPTKKRTLSDEDSKMAMLVIGISFALLFIIFCTVYFVKCCCYTCKCCPNTNQEV